MGNSRIVRYVAYIVEILLAFIVQNTPNLLPEIFGGKAILMLPLAISFAIFENEITAIVFSLICGLLADCGYGGAIGYYAITLMIMCYVVSVLAGNYIRPDILSAILAAVIGIPIIICGQFLFYYAAAGYGGAGVFFVRHYISRIIYTLVFMPVFFYINRFVSGKNKKRIEKIIRSGR